MLIFVTDRIIFGNLIFWGVKKTQAYYYNENFDQNNTYERIIYFKIKIRIPIYFNLNIFYKCWPTFLNSYLEIKHFFFFKLNALGNCS